MAQKIITKSYDQEFKSQAVKLAQEIGGHKAATELGIPSGTLCLFTGCSIAQTSLSKKCKEILTISEPSQMPDRSIPPSAHGCR